MPKLNHLLLFVNEEMKCNIRGGTIKQDWKMKAVGQSFKLLLVR